MQEVKFLELRKHIPYQTMFYLLLTVTYSTLESWNCNIRGIFHLQISASVTGIPYSTCPFTLREECKFWVFKDRRVSGYQTEWQKFRERYRMRNFVNGIKHCIKIIKSRSNTGGTSNTYGTHQKWPQNFSRNTYCKRHLGVPRSRRVDLKIIALDIIDCIHHVQCLVNTVRYF
jgi:hypothetical protein